MTTFPPGHLNVIKQQAHALRDLLIEAEVVTEVPNKSKWLSIFARGIGDFSDWGTLQNLANGFSTNAPKAVLIGDAIERLTYTIRNELGDSTVDLTDVYHAIITVCSPEEKEMNGFDHDYSITPTNEFILEIPPTSNYELPFLLWFWKLNYERSLESVVTEYSILMKDKRRECSDNEEIKEHFFDVFEKKGEHTVSSIIHKLVDKFHIQLNERNGTTYMELSTIGRGYIERHLTNDFDDVWQSWWSCFKEQALKLPFYKLDDNWSGYIKKYSEGLPAEKAAAQYDYHSEFKRIGDMVVESLGAESLNKQERLIYLSPRMVLAPVQYNLPAKDIEISIEGPEWAIISTSFKLSKLWPNKRYIGLSVNGQSGWFVKIPDEITHFTMKYHWTSKSGAFPPASHEITYYLSANRDFPNCRFFYACITEDCEFAPMSTYEDCPVTMSSLTHGEKLSIDQIKELERVKAGMTYIEYTKNFGIIKEKRHLLATNEYELAKFLEI